MGTFAASWRLPARAPHLAAARLRLLPKLSAANCSRRAFARRAAGLRATPPWRRCRQKAADQVGYRPPNYESPLDYFRTPITPNDEFFVRYHLSDIPDVDAKTYKIDGRRRRRQRPGRTHARRSEKAAGL